MTWMFAQDQDTHVLLRVLFGSCRHECNRCLTYGSSDSPGSAGQQQDTRRAINTCKRSSQTQLLHCCLQLLLCSGHGAFWTLAPLTSQAYYPHRLSTSLLWIALAQTSIRDVIDKQHYTVDMFLSVVVTWAVWDWLNWVYPPSQPLPPRPKEQPADKPNPFVLSVVAFGLLTAAVVVFVAKA